MKYLLILTLAAALPLPVLATTSSLAGQRPNILFILSDDLGYGDLGCYGQKQIRTPRLDQMASEGLRFTDAYSGSAVCAPSRATLLTGLTTGHTKVRKNGNSLFGPNERTAAQMLKQAGYRTAHFGKWGMATANGEGAPERHGFDETLVYLTHRQAHDYTPDTLWQNGKSIEVTSGTYAPDLFTSAALKFLAQKHDKPFFLYLAYTSAALKFLAQKHDKPFFLYLAYTTPHAHNALGSETGNGMEIPSDAPYSDKEWPQPQKNHAAMITAMDNQVGQVLNTLQETGLAENTIVIFTSDNGPHKEGGARPDFFDSNGPLRGIKRDLYEGGIRVPFIAWWPGKISPGTTDTPIAFWDFVPTAAELAETTLLHPVDGIALTPLLAGAKAPDREYLYWELQDGSKLGSYQGEQRAVRMGQWKAIRRGKGVELYDLSKDLGERQNVASANPEIVAKAEQLFESARTAPEDN